MSTEVSVSDDAVQPKLHRRLRRRRKGGRFSSILVGFGLAWIVLLVLAALTANVLPIADPYSSVGPPRTPPFQMWPEFLGTDGVGRSILSRMIYGARASLAIGLLSVVCGGLIGCSLGLVTGFRRGRLDSVVGVVTTAMLAFPGIVLLLALGSFLGPGMKTLIIGMGVISAPAFLRVTRANTLRFADREFVQASQLSGASARRTMLREVSPNVLPPLIGYAVIVMATLITAEASVSYLGLGLRPPEPSWGEAIANGQYDLVSYPHLVMVPTIFLAVTVYALNVIGDAIRRKFDIGIAKI